MTAPAALDFAGLLRGVLKVADGEFISIGYEDNTAGLPWRTVVKAPADALAYVDKLSDTADVFFGVCPTRGPARVGGSRGGEADITRLPALWADLDVCAGKCPSIDVAHKIIGDLTAVVGTRPSAITDSGHGLHPYWPLADGRVTGGDVGPQLALIARWGRLVAAVAKERGAKVDDVYDLARMLRVPGTFNNKAAA